MPKITANMPRTAHGNAPSTKMYVRMQQVARYVATGRFTNQKIADLVGLTLHGLTSLMARPDYQEIEAALFEGRLSEIDKEIAADDEKLAGMMRTAVPAALNTLIETVVQKRDLRAALTAAKEILDRDPKGTFSANRGLGGNGGAEAPKLPADIIAHLAVEGNKVVAEIRSASSGTTRAEVTMPPAVQAKLDEAVAEFLPLTAEGEA